MFPYIQKLGSLKLTLYLAINLTLFGVKKPVQIATNNLPKKIARSFVTQVMVREKLFGVWKFLEISFKSFFQYYNIDINLISGNVKINLKRDCEQIPLIKEMLDIIHNNETAVAKALSFLEIDSRENNRINVKDETDTITERKSEFGYEGKYIFSAVNSKYNKHFLLTFVSLDLYSFTS